jgi:hypothetical protein
MPNRPSTRTILIVASSGAIGGILTFLALAWRAVTVERADVSQAVERFAAIRAAMGVGGPLLELDAEGRVTRRVSPPSVPPATISRVKAMAYQPALGRLVTADSPLWFLKLKGPAANLALRETGIDLEQLGITPADLERYGPRIVVDHTRQDGARLLVWTE